MRRWIWLAAALYPRSWRAEFGEEFRAVLDDVKPSWRVFANVLRGAIEMRIVDGSNWAKLVAAMAVAGAFVGFGVSYRVAPMYISSATISVTPVADPVRPASADLLRERALQRTQQIQMEMLSRAELSSIINDPRIVLYYAELQRMPLETVIDRMRRDIRIEEVPTARSGLAPLVFRISFAYPDAIKAKATVREITTKFTTWNASVNRMRDVNYEDFWRRMSAVKRVKSVPPPPPGDAIAIRTPASPPVRSDPHRLPFLAWGAGIGTLLGLLAALIVRWPRHTRRIAAFAAAGVAAAFAVSLLIPNRYTSTAMLEIQPAQITDDPFAPLPAAPTVAEFLRRVEPEILSSQNLARIIQDRRLDLYTHERARKSMEEVIGEMRANLSITPIHSVPAFRISFTYPDRFKAQQTATRMIGRFEELNQEMAIRQEVTTQRKAGEILDVLDIASLPMNPVFPNRWMFAGAGLLVGVLIGAISFRFRRPGTPKAFREFCVGPKPDGRAEARPHVGLLQIEVDGTDYGFRAG